MTITDLIPKWLKEMFAKPAEPSRSVTQQKTAEPAAPAATAKAPPEQAHPPDLEEDGRPGYRVYWRF